MSDVEGLAEGERAMLHPCYSHQYEAVERIIAARVQAARAEERRRWFASTAHLFERRASKVHDHEGNLTGYYIDADTWREVRAAALRADDAGGEGL